MPYARDSFFVGRAGEFATLADMQADALRWSASVANARQHRGLDRVAPGVLFDAEEAAALSALPASRRAGEVVQPQGGARHPPVD